jgi:hypothetical protein
MGKHIDGYMYMLKYLLDEIFFLATPYRTKVLYCVLAHKDIHICTRSMYVNEDRTVTRVRFGLARTRPLSSSTSTTSIPRALLVTTNHRE